MIGCAPRVLVVDDDPDMRKMVCDYLTPKGCLVSQAIDGDAALAQIAADPPEVILLDIGLPDVSGTDLFADIQAQCPDAAVIFITALNEGELAAEMVRRGAVHYLVKPIQMSRLWKVVQEAWTARQAGEQVRAGEWLVDLRSNRATREGETISLTPLESALLACLFRYRGQVVDVETLRREVWGCTSGVEPNAAWTAVHRLKAKIGPEGVVTVKGKGYLLAEAPKL